MTENKSQPEKTLHPLFHEASNGGVSRVRIDADRFSVPYESDTAIALLDGAVILHSSSENRSTVALKHLWAKDAEGDSCFIAQYEFQDLRLASSYHGEFRFTGWLTAARYYDGENPFDDAVKQDTESEPWANNGYPYIPPVQGPQHLPQRVEITYYAPTRADSE